MNRARERYIMRTWHGSRREFLGLTGGALAGFATARGRAIAAPLESQTADLVGYNAKVYTVDSRAPKTEAFAITAGGFSRGGGRAGGYRRPGPRSDAEAAAH